VDAVKNTYRYHLLCAREDAAAVQKALDAALPEWVLLVPLDDEPTLSGASGQWTEEESALLLRVVEEIHGLKVWRGPPLGIVEPGIVVVDKGGDVARQGDLRFTIEKAIEEAKLATTEARRT
jgi:hypothetical protein